MSFALFKCIREVSSEDEVHCAKNLFHEKHGKKWKTKDVGEKLAYTILELDEPKQITAIDIGNEHSAFVEVLVSNSGCRPEDFTEILLSCSFMTPAESRNSTMTNRVRCFNSEALVSDTLSKKWKLVKIICTQPYNKHVQYGLSFIKLHVIAEKIPQKQIPKCLVPENFLSKKTTELKPNENEKNLVNKPMYGKFALKEESPDSESESTASLFKRWKMSRDSNESSNQTTSIKENRRGSIETNKNEGITEIKDRNRESLLFGNDDEDISNDKKKQRLERVIEMDRCKLEEENKNKRKKETTPRRNSNADAKDGSKIKTKGNTPKIKEEKNKKKNSLSSNCEDKPSTSKSPNLNVDRNIKKRMSSPILNENPSKKPNLKSDQIKYRPFNQLLSGAVIVISGIQNPDRANLRNQALKLGAKYKADWENGCTHLICAFKNTPKYNQVKGMGKIVNRKWIEQCYEDKKYLPWRRFALDSADLAKVESDEEILDESLKPSTYQRTPLQINNNEDNVELEKVKSPSQVYDESDKEHLTDAEDTDDEIQRVTLNLNSQRNRKNVKKEENEFDASTDEEDYLKTKLKQIKDVLN